MIVAKTKMRKLPENCKKCMMSSVEYDWPYSYRVCRILGVVCPTERSDRGNEKYGKLDDCPLFEMQ